MSDYEKMAAAILPPRQGDIRVLAITTSASAVQDSEVSSGPHFITLICETAFYITFTANGTNVITDPDGTATSGNARTMLVPANQPTPFIVSQMERYFKVRGTGAGTLRWYLSSR